MNTFNMQKTFTIFWHFPGGRGTSQWSYSFKTDIPDS